MKRMIEDSDQEAIQKPFTYEEKMFTALPFYSTEYLCPNDNNRLMMLYDRNRGFCPRCNKTYILNKEVSKNDIESNGST